MNRVIMSKPTGNPVDGSERSKNSHCPDGAQVQFLHVEAVFQGTERKKYRVKTNFFPYPTTKVEV